MSRRHEHMKRACTIVRQIVRIEEGGTIQTSAWPDEALVLAIISGVSNLWS